jgi:hypothetical protein
MVAGFLTSWLFLANRNRRRPAECRQSLSESADRSALAYNTIRETHTANGVARWAETDGFYANIFARLMSEEP